VITRIKAKPFAQQNVLLKTFFVVVNNQFEHEIFDECSIFVAHKSDIELIKINGSNKLKCKPRLGKHTFNTNTLPSMDIIPVHISY
jgi:hypothetical protein